MTCVVFINDAAYRGYVDTVSDLLDIRKHVRVVHFTPDEAAQNFELLAGANLVVTVHSTLAQVHAICEKLKGITPTLTLQDGVIEYRSSKHRTQGIFRYRPLATDYIAAFGPRSKSLLMASGTQENQIFITGCPRFDLYPSERQNVPKDGYILVTMSNRPAYGADNLVAFYTLLNDVLTYLETNNINFKLRPSRGISPGGVEHINKVQGGMEPAAIERFRNIPRTPTVPIIEDLRGAFAVLTTPSTPSLEAIAMGRKLCHMIFDPETVYMQSPWVIHGQQDIQRVISELYNPPRFKMEFQDMVLNDNLLNDGKSTERVCNLIEKLTNAKLYS